MVSALFSYLWIFCTLVVTTFFLHKFYLFHPIRGVSGSRSYQIIQLFQIELEAVAPDAVVQLPVYITDNKTSVVQMKASDGNLAIQGSVNAPGSYVIVAHYFQPYHPSQ